MWGALSDEREALSFAGVTFGSNKFVVSIYIYQNYNDTENINMTPSQGLLSVILLGTDPTENTVFYFKKNGPLPRNGYMRTTSKTPLPLLFYLQRVA
jgi:hypothetical protein